MWPPSARVTGSSLRESLEKSIDLNKPGGAIDFFFLAMTRWHQGQAERRPGELFAQAATYLQHNPGDPELERIS